MTIDWIYFKKCLQQVGKMLLINDFKLKIINDNLVFYYKNKKFKIKIVIDFSLNESYEIKEVLMQLYFNNEKPINMKANNEEELKFNLIKIRSILIFIFSNNND